MRQFPALLFITAGLCASPVFAEATASAPVERQMDEITVVAGYQPGPGLWRVSQGEHELWVLATVSPLPKRMRWPADEARAVIAESQSVIAPPNVDFDFDRGTFGMLMLLPTAMGARKNPDKETLADQLPPELYARWLVQKKKFMGRDRGVEKFRPIFAANELFEAVLDDLDLSGKPVVWPVVEKAAKNHDVAIVEPKVTIRIDDTKGKLKAFRDTELDDVACLESTLTLLENDLHVLKERANAWATGDVGALRVMSLTERASACTNALLGSSFVQDSGLANLQQRVADAWLVDAKKALAANRSTFAVLGLGQVLDNTRYLAALRAEGYVVEAPGESAEALGNPAATPE